MHANGTPRALAAAPNLHLHFAATRAAALSLVSSQAAAARPFQLVLLGEICSEAAEDVSKRELEALVRDLDPRQGSLCDDMRSKPLIAVQSHSVLARSGYDLGITPNLDAVMSKPLNASLLHVLLDFASED